MRITEIENLNPGDGEIVAIRLTSKQYKELIEKISEIEFSKPTVKNIAHPYLDVKGRTIKFS